MQRFSVGNAFSEAMAFVKENLTNLLLLLGTAIVIGQVAQAVLLGGSTDQLSENLVRSFQSGDISGGTAMIGGAVFAMFIAALLQSAAQFAVLRQGLSEEKDIAATMIYGLVATIVNLLFWMVVGAVIGGIIFALVAVTGVGAGLASGEPNIGAIAGVLGILLLVVFPLAIWLGARLWVASAGMAQARSVNPIYGLTEAWRLTSGSVQWPVLGTLLLFILVIFAVSMVLGIVSALLMLIAGPMVGAIIAGVVAGVPTGIISLGMTAGVYRALVPQDTRYDIFN